MVNFRVDTPYQVKPLHIIGGKVDYVTNWDLSDSHLTQSQHLERIAYLEYKR